MSSNYGTLTIRAAFNIQRHSGSAPENRMRVVYRNDFVTRDSAQEMFDTFKAENPGLEVAGEFKPRSEYL
jgi:hypothetical protein